MQNKDVTEYGMWRTIFHQLKDHAPFTAMGTLVGLLILMGALWIGPSNKVVAGLFWTFHPGHVFFSALATGAMYRLHVKGPIWKFAVITYVGSIGIGTLSDCIMPFVAESLLDMPERHIHLGFIEMWWLVNPLAIAGMVIAYWKPLTKVPHAAHVLISTAATLFHIIMAKGNMTFSIGVVSVLAVFLFLAVWLPCCASDIVFPILFTGKPEPCRCMKRHADAKED